MMKPKKIVGLLIVQVLSIGWWGCSPSQPGQKNKQKAVTSVALSPQSANPVDPFSLGNQALFSAQEAFNQNGTPYQGDPSSCMYYWPGHNQVCIDPPPYQMCDGNGQNCRTEDPVCKCGGSNAAKMPGGIPLVDNLKQVSATDLELHWVPAAGTPISNTYRVYFCRKENFTQFMDFCSFKDIPETQSHLVMSHWDERYQPLEVNISRSTLAGVPTLFFRDTQPLPTASNGTAYLTYAVTAVDSAGIESLPITFFNHLHAIPYPCYEGSPDEYRNYRLGNPANPQPWCHCSDGGTYSEYWTQGTFCSGCWGGNACAFGGSNSASGSGQSASTQQSVSKGYSNSAISTSRSFSSLSIGSTASVSRSTASNAQSASSTSAGNCANVNVTVSTPSVLTGTACGGSGVQVRFTVSRTNNSTATGFGVSKCGQPGSSGGCSSSDPASFDPLPSNYGFDPMSGAPITVTSCCRPGYHCKWMITPKGTCGNITISGNSIFTTRVSP